MSENPSEQLSKQKNQINNIKQTVNRILPKNKSNKIKELMNELSPENSRIKKIGNKLKEFGTSAEQLAQEKKDEIEKGIFEILGVENSDKDAVKKAPNFVMIVIIVLLVLGGIVAVIMLVAVPKINEKIAEIRKNWPEYRCKNPYRMFPSTFGPEGTTSDENNAYCDAQAANSAYNSNIGGVQNQIDSQNNSIQNITESIFA